MIPRVVLIAATNLYRMDLAENTPYIEHMFPEDVVLACDELAEVAGRVRAFNFSTDDRPTNRALLGDMLGRGQTVEFDHAHATFYIDQVSRDFTHDFFRRLTVSELSLRFTSMHDAMPVVPKPYLHDDDMIEDHEEHFERSLMLYDAHFSRLRMAGFTETDARTAAATLLPGCTETAVVVTGSIAQWRDAVTKADSVSASYEMRTVGAAIRRHLHRIAPHSFQDVPGSPLAVVPEPAEAAA